MNADRLELLFPVAQEVAGVMTRMGRRSTVEKTSTTGGEDDNGEE